MRPVLDFVKTTVIGGLLFLFPLVIVTVVVGKAFSVMLRLTRPIGRLLPIDSVADVATIDIVAIVALLAGCFAAGFVAQSPLGRRVYRTADENLAGLVPGYAALEARLGGAVGDEEQRLALKPVLVRFDDLSQVAFEIERLRDAWVAVFLPGAPDPWSATAAVVDNDRVTALDLEIIQVTRMLKDFGRGVAVALGKDDVRQV